MNSVEIAKKLIKENEEDLEEVRTEETIIRKIIAKYKYDIGTHEQRIESLRGAITMAEEDLRRVRSTKDEILVDNTALRLYVMTGGGSDMLD